LPNQHFRKNWQLHVRTWFDQPGKKKSRRLARIQKAARITPRPIDGLLRPAVRCPTLKYNTKLRVGRGFTLDELKEAGIRRKEALTIGISVDHRRRNRSSESLALNVQRLKTYKSKLIVFPRKTGKPKNGDSEAAEIKTVSQLRGPLFPIVQLGQDITERQITEEEKSSNAYATLRKAQSDLRLVGVRAKRQKEKAEEDPLKKKEK